MYTFANHNILSFHIYPNICITILKYHNPPVYCIRQFYELQGNLTVQVLEDSELLSSAIPSGNHCYQRRWEEIDLNIMILTDWRIGLKKTRLQFSKNENKDYNYIKITVAHKIGKWQLVEVAKKKIKRCIIMYLSSEAITQF